MEGPWLERHGLTALRWRGPRRDADEGLAKRVEGFKVVSSA